MAITITQNLTAAQTPTPQAPDLQIFAGNSGNPGNAPTSSSLAQGDTSALLVKFNQNATRADVNATYGGGGYAIIWGLTLSQVSGLTLGIASGQGMIYGLTEVASSTTLTMPATSSGCCIWLKQDGTVTYQNGSLVPPDSSSLYIGTITTNGTGITGIDTSGVVYAKGKQLWRQTADTQAPTDAPPSTMAGLITYTLGGIYDWDSSQHKQRVPPEQLIFKANGPTFVGGHIYYSVAVSSGSGSLTLSASSANIQRFTPTASSVTVSLPSTGLITAGMHFEVYNDAASGSGFNAILKDSTGTVTVATITPQRFVKVRPAYNAGIINWPSTVTVQSP